MIENILSEVRMLEEQQVTAIKIDLMHNEKLLSSIVLNIKGRCLAGRVMNALSSSTMFPRSNRFRVKVRFNSRTNLFL